MYLNLEKKKNLDENELSEICQLKQVIGHLIISIINELISLSYQMHYKMNILFVVCILYINCTEFWNHSKKSFREFIIYVD